MKTWRRIGIALFASLAIAGCSKMSDNLLEPKSGKEGKAASAEKGGGTKAKGNKGQKTEKPSNTEKTRCAR